MADLVNYYNDVNPMDSLFDSMMNVFSYNSRKLPSVDIEETKDEYRITAELPGFKENDVRLYVDKHVLHIEAEYQEEEKDPDERKYLIRERSKRSLERSFTLPEGLDEKAIKASFENGLLSIELPKLPAEKPRKIPVLIGNKSN